MQPGKPKRRANSRSTTSWRAQVSELDVLPVKRSRNKRRKLVTMHVGVEKSLRTGCELGTPFMMQYQDLCS
jgi:hypothetical protein